MNNTNGNSSSLITTVNDHHLKVLLVGDTRVGKTSLLSQYRDGQFCDKYTSTVGVDFVIKRVKDGTNKAVRLEIWDSSGDEKYQTLTTSYYRDMSAMIIVFDVTNKQSFDNMDNWLREINKYALPSVCNILVGNKSDLTAERVIGYDSAQALADTLHIPYMETSAKDLSSVDRTFKSIIHHIRASRNGMLTEDNFTEGRKAVWSRRLLLVRVPLMCLFAAATIYLLSRNFTRLQRIFTVPRLQKI